MNKSNRCAVSLFLYGCLLLVAGCATQSDRPDSFMERCADLSPPMLKNASFVQWVIDKEGDFKKKGCWKQHTLLGEEAIKIAGGAGDHKSVMRLFVQLASTYFYLGELQKCEDSALSANKIAIALSDRKTEVQSLYLLSAAKRARGDISAISVAENALHLCNQYLPDDKGLKAKVLFNLGAAESDIEPTSLKRAELHLKEAGRLFAGEGQKNDELRVGLRLARVEYLQGKFSEAEKTIARFQGYDKTPRNEMMCLYQIAKIQHRLSQWNEAMVNSKKSYQLAKELDAKKDMERISSLIETINKRQFLSE